MDLWKVEQRVRVPQLDQGVVVVVDTTMATPLRTPSLDGISSFFLCLLPQP